MDESEALKRGREWERLGYEQALPLPAGTGAGNECTDPGTVGRDVIPAVTGSPDAVVAVAVPLDEQCGTLVGESPLKQRLGAITGPERLHLLGVARLQPHPSLVAGRNRGAFETGNRKVPFDLETEGHAALRRDTMAWRAAGERLSCRHRSSAR